MLSFSFKPHNYQWEATVVGPERPSKVGHAGHADRKWARLGVGVLVAVGLQSLHALQQEKATDQTLYEQPDEGDG